MRHPRAAIGHLVMRLAVNHAAESIAVVAESDGITYRVHRAVLVLHYYVGMSVPMVAETLGVPLGTAQSRLGRALATLRTTLGPEFDTENEPLQRGGIA